MNLSAGPAAFQDSLGNNYQVFVGEGNQVRHWWLDIATQEWHQGRLFGSNICSALGAFQNRVQGNYEVFFLEKVPEGTGHTLPVRHWWLDIATHQWHQGRLFGGPLAGAPYAFQSRLGDNYEVFFEEGSSISSRIRHWWMDTATQEWHQGPLFGAPQAGSPAAFQNRLQGNYEVFFHEPGGIRHWWLDIAAQQWHEGQLFGGPRGFAPAAFQSHDHGNYEVFFKEGDQVRHWWLEIATQQWHQGRLFGNNVRYAPAAFQDQVSGNYEVFFGEGNRLRRWWLDASTGDWIPGELFG